jgi:general secretion pathway protein D
LLASQNLELVSDATSGLYRLMGQEGSPRQLPTAAPQPQTGSQVPELFVIHLRHARAADVAATVNALYGKANALGDIGERPSTLARDLQQNQVPPAGAPPQQAVAGAVGKAATLMGDVTIVPDARGNSLLIRASRADFALIQAAVEQVDVRPLQVLIEVLIAEVRKDRTLDFGLDVSLPPTNPRGMPHTTVQGDLTGAGSGIGLGDLAIKVMDSAPRISTRRFRRQLPVAT